mgnify:CR=1 FL=1
MSCIITYNGQNFTQEDFLDYLKSQIPASNIIKPGIEELFESNPELAEIGTQEQYSQYLDTIFPDSKVKEIVYHFSTTKIEKPNKEKFSLSANINRRKGFFGINKNVNPCSSCRCRNRFTICAWIETSSDAIGSSAINSSGSITTARAIATRCC